VPFLESDLRNPPKPQAEIDIDAAGVGEGLARYEIFGLRCSDPVPGGRGSGHFQVRHVDGICAKMSRMSRFNERAILVFKIDNTLTHSILRFV